MTDPANVPPSRPPLRVWPGILAAALVLIARFVVPLVVGDAGAGILGGLAAGTLLLLGDGTPLVGAVTPISQVIGPEQPDGGQVQILHFTGTPAGLPSGGALRRR